MEIQASVPSSSHWTKSPEASLIYKAFGVTSGELSRAQLYQSLARSLGSRSVARAPRGASACLTLHLLLTCPVPLVPAQLLPCHSTDLRILPAWHADLSCEALRPLLNDPSSGPVKSLIHCEETYRIRIYAPSNLASTCELKTGRSWKYSVRRFHFFSLPLSQWGSGASWLIAPQASVLRLYHL